MLLSNVSLCRYIEGVADAAVSALCLLAGVDAADEVLHDGSNGAGAAGLAKVAIAGLEAALSGPGGGADDAATG